jgi:hypothetical protein
MLLESLPLEVLLNKPRIIKPQKQDTPYSAPTPNTKQPPSLFTGGQYESLGGQ